ncbi:hypothetical protein [Halovenus sp. HT40]|uniref:hypothetical protein n=1 Tax=Halovenus sp. HT40 TaxID=3126691 RepID=UPI00300F1B7C
MPRPNIMTLGCTNGEEVGIPPSVWNLHTLITGRTGSGKTTTATKAISTAHPVTDGPTIVIDPKKSGWIREVARTHYAQTSSLEDVLYFDCNQYLPALSMFDIRPMLDGEKLRNQAIADLSEHFVQLIDHLIPQGFETVRSQDVIKHLMRALFDSHHGSDAFTIGDLQTAIYELYKHETVPEVADPETDQLLDNLLVGTQHNNENVFDGALTRVEKVYANERLSTLFSHVPADQTEAFRFDKWLNEDVLILIDLGWAATHTKRVLANVLLEELYRSLTRQRQTARQNDPPYVLLFVDEVANLRVDAPLKKLLTMGREFNVGTVPMLQYPKQLDSDGKTQATAEVDIYSEVLNNCETVLTGAVRGDEMLVNRLSGSHMSSGEVQNRVSNLAANKWFFQPAGSRGYGSVQSFVVEEPPLPPGHPDGPAPLTDDERSEFQEALEACKRQTEAEHGISLTGSTQRAGRVSTTVTEPAEQSVGNLSQYRRTQAITTLPWLESLPGRALYESAANAITCATCGADRPATLRGLLETVACHGSLNELHRDAIPPVHVRLTLTEPEIEAAPVSPRLLCGLQVLYNMAQNRYAPLEFDIVHDSPHTVLKRFGIDSAGLSKLQEEGLVTNNKLHRYSYYRVTEQGRDLLNRSHRQGIEVGHNRGDTTETMLHKAMIEALRRYVVQEYRDDPDSPVTKVDSYYELSEHHRQFDLDGGTRFDLVGRDDDGTVRLIGEAELDHNDGNEPPVRDYDQIATVEPDEALWVVGSSSRGHDAVLTPLADPPAELGKPRIDAYSESSRIEEISGIDTPGITGIFTLNQLRKQLPEPELPETPPQ